MPPKFSSIPKPKSGPSPLTAQTQARFQFAIALHQQGRLAQARDIYLDILRTQPKHFDSLHLLGVMAYQTGDHKRAVDLIGKAVELHPYNHAFHYNLGLALTELKQVDAAVASYDKVIAIEPGHADAHCNRGNLLGQLKQLSAAIASYDKAIAIHPGYADAYSNRGHFLRELGQLDAAVASCDKAIAIRPDHAAAYSNRGNALRDLRQLDAAVESYDRAIAVRPDYAEAYSNRGNALLDLKQLDAAIASFDRAIAIRPDYADAYYNRGNALLELKQLHAAVESYDRAIAIKPDYADAYWNKAIALLTNGDFAKGWGLYEWRWKTDASTSSKRNFTQPLWLGVESLKDKTILLHTEQGLGDVIQFCRYAKLVAALGARVITEVPESLAGLLQGLEGVSEWVAKEKPLPAFDYHCPLLSLPLAFKTDITSIPGSAGYLRTDRDKVSDWASKLGTRSKPRVGIVWSGSTVHKNDRNRSMLLSTLMAQLPGNCEYVSLQKEVRDIDKAALEASAQLRHFGSELHDFADTAALCELMDVVISVDTSVAHLSGAMGKPTWVLLPYMPDWRWLLDRDDSPWYESMRLYRQDKRGDWDGVLARVNADLEELVKTGS